MKKKIVLSIFSFWLLSVGSSWAALPDGGSPADENTEVNDADRQRVQTVQGIVTDKDGEPIIGVTIVVNGTTKGTTTDIDGKFSIEVDRSAVLTFAYLGYMQQEVPVGRQRFLRVVMSEDTETLEEVVVIGYGTAKRSNLTGAVSSVTNEQFKAQPVKDVTEILQGRMAGVQASSYTGGQLGAEANVRVRGVSSINFGNDPLWVVDGVIGGSVTNPADIASIEVLKDASSTAIYGSRGANGVILVTTKRGSVGKPQVQISSEIGLSNFPKRFDIMNAYEYAQALEQMTDTRFSAEDMEAFRNGTKGVDYQDLMLQRGISQDYKLSISGGSARNKYMVSGLFLNQTGMTAESKLRRIGFHANMDSQVTDWLNVVTNLEGSTETTHNTGADLMVMANYSPAMDLTDENGVYQRDPYCSISANPYGALKVNDSDGENYNVKGYVDFRFNIIDGLTFSAQGAFNLLNASSYSFSSTKREPSAISSMGNSMNRTVTYQETNNLTWQKDFNGHNITATGVFELYMKEYKNVGVSGQDLLSEKTGYWNINSVQSGLTGATNYTKESMVSAFGRVMYNYKNRYYLTGTIRADGSSKFMNHKWGYFPSAAVAWNIAQENFMQGQDIFQDLKLRGSFGVTGNQAINAYGTLGLLTLANYSYGTGSLYPGYWESTYASPDLTWEKTYSYDAGIDISMLNRRLFLTVDWYKKNTKDLLFAKTIPYFNGGGSYWSNVGEMYSTGWEFTVEASPVRTLDFEWNTSFTASYLRTEVTDLDGEDYLIPDATRGGLMEGNVFIMKEGLPISNFNLFKWVGFDENGANLYQTADGGTTTSPVDADRVVMGNPIPKWNLGWNNTFTYKNWELNVFFRASTGFQRLNVTRFAMTTMIPESRFITSKEGFEKNWDVVANKADAEFASSSNSLNRSTPRSSQWLEDADFLRLQNISLSYLLPRKVTKFADITLGVSAQNLFTLTKYKGLDPESSTTSATTTGAVSDKELGLDYGSYPSARTFTFTVKLGF